MNRRPSFFLLFFAISCLLTFHAFSFGQSDTATLSGLITDPQGKVVPDADVEVTNMGTNISVHHATNRVGLYVVVGLQPGHYRVSVTKEGFRRIDLTDLVLNVQDVLSRNFQLQLGPVMASITVVADQARVNTESASVGTVIDRQFVNNLPLNGRSIQTLIALSPGLVNTPVASNGSDQGQFSANGMRTNSNDFTVDGVSANFGVPVFEGLAQGASGSLPATNIQGGFSNLVSVDALQEFKIQTSTFAPEFGRSPGAQISLVTRSGSNQFHGSVYDYFRNDALDAVSYFDLKKTPLRFNDFGGTLGGPILLPGYNGRSKTFFFFSYEGQRFLLPQPKLLTYVPSLAARSGASTSTAKAILDAFPLPNGPDVVDESGNPTGAARLTANFSNLNSSDAYSVRIDHTFNAKYSIFGRYNHAPSFADSRKGNISELDRFIQTTDTITLGSTQTLCPEVVNDLRLNWSRNLGKWHQTFDGLGGAQHPPDASIFLPQRGRYTYMILPLVIPISTSNDPGAQAAAVNFGPVANNQGSSVNIVDNVAWSAGSHLLDWGGDFRRLSPRQSSAPLAVSALFFDMNTVYNDSVNVVSFLQNAGTTLHDSNLSLYAQDTWHATRHLTLTYGVRWEIVPPPSLAGGKKTVTLAQPPDLSSLDQTSLRLAPLGTRFYPTSYTRFAPRVGIAYQLSSRGGRALVLRGGGGIFYDLGSTPFSGISWPYVASDHALNAALPITSDDINFGPPDFTPSPTNRAYAIVAGPHFTLPKNYQWNTTVEQELDKNDSVSVGYVGSAGTKLLRTLDLQLAQPGEAPNVYFSPNFSGLAYVDNASSSDYNSLQIQFLRRLSHGVQAMASYTWAHSLDDNSSDASVPAPGYIFPVSANRGNSSFDIRHAVTGAITYEIPSPKWQPIVDRIVAGWSLSGTFFIRSGVPFDVRYGEIDPVFGQVITLRRMDLVPGAPLWLDDPAVPAHKRLNLNAFAAPADGSIGTLGRNSLQGFSAWQADIGVHRVFSIADRVKTEFRAELFNIFNHPNFATPDTGYFNYGPDSGGVIVSPTFGQAVTTLARGFNGGGNTGGFNPLFQSGGPRSVQLTLRLSF